jgi:hypothetical protein
VAHLLPLLLLLLLLGGHGGLRRGSLGCGRSLLGLLGLLGLLLTGGARGVVVAGRELFCRQAK